MLVSIVLFTPDTIFVGVFVDTLTPAAGSVPDTLVVAACRYSLVDT